MYFVVVAVVVVVVVAVLFILSFCRARIPGSWDLTESIEMFPDALWFQTSDRSVVCQHVFPESSTPGVLFYFKKHISMASGLQMAAYVYSCIMTSVISAGSG